MLLINEVRVKKCVCTSVNDRQDEIKMHQPGIEPGSHRWQRCILPLAHWCCWLDRFWGMLYIVIEEACNIDWCWKTEHFRRDKLWVTFKETGLNCVMWGDNSRCCWKWSCTWELGSWNLWFFTFSVFLTEVGTSQHDCQKRMGGGSQEEKERERSWVESIESTLSWWLT